MCFFPINSLGIAVPRHRLNGQKVAKQLKLVQGAADIVLLCWQVFQEKRQQRVADEIPAEVLDNRISLTNRGGHGRLKRREGVKRGLVSLLVYK